MIWSDFACGIPTHNALGENIGLLTSPLLDRSRHNLFRMPQAIHGRRVNPIHTQLESLVYRRDGFCVVLRAPAVFPASTANRPSAKPYRRNVQIGISEFTSVHSSYAFANRMPPEMRV